MRTVGIDCEPLRGTVKLLKLSKRKVGKRLKTINLYFNGPQTRCHGETAWSGYKFFSGLVGKRET